VVKPRELPALLERLVAQDAPAAPAPPIGEVRRMEGGELGQPAEIVCPACHGVLTELERALWSAERALEESARLALRLARAERSEEMRGRFMEKATTLERQAAVIRDVLL